AWRSTDDAVLVACATGELVTLPSAGGAATSSVVVRRDLRDVLVVGGQVVVSTFRSAQLLWVAADGTVTQTLALPSNDGGDARVAWRTIADASGNLVVVHQLQSIEEIDTTQPSSYGGGGSSIVQTGVSTVSPDGEILNDTLVPSAVLPVDEALSPDGSTLYVAAAGNAATQSLASIVAAPVLGGFNPGSLGGQLPSGQVTAVAFDAAGDALAFVREPAALWIERAGEGGFVPVSFGAVSRDDTGHDVFHTQAGALIACASCHPEGGDDGHIWDLDGNERRTPSLRGTIVGTAPYHWPGDMKDLDALVDQVYVQRMSGTQLDPGQMNVLEGWVQSIPAPPAPSWVDTAAAARGQALFEGDQAGCSVCHSGDKLTNNMTVSVGTGGAFQVPPLVGVGWRTPLLHDGCAISVADRFGRCATPGHGSTAGLSTQNVSDLVAYLDSL
ncbi:MAG TPA: cytochrome c, partial [Polyangiaceae bacterium]